MDGFKKLRPYLRYLPSSLFCLAVLILCYLVTQRHHRLISLNFENDALYQLETVIYDIKNKLRGPVEPSGKIGVLAIDEKSVTAFGDWPFSRRYYGQALKNLKNLGVKFVGFDVTFTDPQKARLEDAQDLMTQLSVDIQSGNIDKARAVWERSRGWLSLSPGDANFASIVGELGNVILGYFTFKTPWESEMNLGKDTSKYFVDMDLISQSEIAGVDLPAGLDLDSFRGRLGKAYGLKSNFPELNKANSHFGFFSNNSDADAINRWVTLVENIQGKLMPSLALKTAAEHLNAEIFVVFDALGVQSIMLIDRETEEEIRNIPVDPYGAGRLLVKSYGPGETFRHFSLVDAYNNTYTPEERALLKGASLLVGGTATGTQDLRPNVFDPAIDGVENHVAAIENIVSNDFYKRTHDSVSFETILIVLIALLFSPLVILGSSLVSGAAVILFVIGFLVYDWYVMFLDGYWGFVGLPILEITVLFTFTTFYKYLMEEKDKKAVKAAFMHYLSPEVIKEVLDDPDALSVKGNKRDITVFFSDVRGFTTISESLTPEKLCEFMNLYFNPMTEIILNTGGTLDKYIGDAIMAFWGAPIVRKDHPERAAYASIAMLSALDKLQVDLPAMGFPKPDIGIGLNSCMASVGNMGSAVRFSYTGMGDGVNLASRLEGLTKDYGIKILMSEFTAARLSKNKFLSRDLDDIRVKGKNEPVRVFELMRPDYLAKPDDVMALIGTFSLGRECYKRQDWQGALKLFKECLVLHPQDGPSKLYVARTEEYLASPPVGHWDGVYTFKHK